MATCEACDAAGALANGEGIEQRLGGMLVGAVAGIDDAGVAGARARNCAAPAEVCRSTMISAWSASRLSAVSFSVSPLVSDELVAEIFTTSALRRWAASSKLMRVRVLGSTKKFTIVLPRRAGTFLISRVPTFLKAAAVSRMVLISAAVSSWIPSRSLRSHTASRSPRGAARSAGGDARSGDLRLVSVIFFPARRRPARHRSARSARRRAGRRRWECFCRRNPARIGSSRWPRSMSTAS